MKYLFVFLFISAHSAIAQQDSVVIPDPNKYAFSFHIYLSTPFNNYTFTRSGAIGAYLKSKNLNAPSFQFPFYFGGAYQWKRWKLGADFIYSVPAYKVSHTNGITVKNNFNSVAAILGYAFVYDRNRVWFLNMGIGRLSRYINLEKSQNTQTLQMDDFLNPPLTGISPTLLHSNAFYEICLEKVYRTKRMNTVSPVLRFGLRGGLDKVSWKTTSNISIANAPVERVFQVFLQTIFAISTSTVRKEKSI